MRDVLLVICEEAALWFDLRLRATAGSAPQPASAAGATHVPALHIEPTPATRPVVRDQCCPYAGPGTGPLGSNMVPRSPGLRRNLGMSPSPCLGMSPSPCWRPSPPLNPAAVGRGVAPRPSPARRSPLDDPFPGPSRQGCRADPGHSPGRPRPVPIPTQGRTKGLVATSSPDHPGCGEI
jgi:hypothetical protein